MITREDLEKWADQEEVWQLRGQEGALLMLNLLWPIVDKYQRRVLEKGRGLYADEIELLTELEKKLVKV